MPSTPNLRLKTVRTAEGTLVSLRGCAQLNEQLTQEIRAELLQLVSAPDTGKVILSLAGVEYLTSTLLAVLIMIHKRLKQAGERLIVCDVDPQVYEVFEVTKVTTIMEVRHAEPPDAGFSEN